MPPVAKIIANEMQIFRESGAYRQPTQSRKRMIKARQLLLTYPFFVSPGIHCGAVRRMGSDIVLTCKARRREGHDLRRLRSGRECLGGGIVENFDIIKNARALLASMPVSHASEKTKAQYRRTMSKLNDTAKTTAQVIAAAKDTRKVSTWFSRRAAITMVASEQLAGVLAEQDRTQRELRTAAADDVRWGQWRKMIGLIRAWSDLLQQINETPAIDEGTRSARHSKRQDLKKLPPDWRERIIERLPAYSPATLVAAVTGCRPDELVTGVTLSIKDGELVAMITGSKTTIGTGQPWRRLCWSVDSDAVLVRKLIDLVREKQVDGLWKVQIQSAKAFSGAMRAAGRREWPRLTTTVTPYCLRHQAAADMKAAGALTSGEISAALGHCSDVTKTAYGRASMGRAGGVSPARVEAARPVKVKKPSSATAKMTKIIGEKSKNNRVIKAAKSAIKKG